nr:MAG TPA: hypothetical protein [Caudoviricetes sp.]
MDKEIKQLRKEMKKKKHMKFYFWDWLQKNHPVIHWMIWTGLVLTDVVIIVMIIKK